MGFGFKDGNQLLGESFWWFQLAATSGLVTGFGGFQLLGCWFQWFRLVVTMVDLLMVSVVLIDC